MFWHSLIILVRVYVDRIIDYIFSFYYTSVKRVPKITNSLLLESATSLAKKIRERQITSEDLVRAFITRIKEVNPIINAVVEDRFDIALAEAKEVDVDIKSGRANFEDKPFLGVPFTTKNTVQCKGMECSFGLICRKDIIANEDADVVLSLKRAGAILLAVTNVPQLSMWMESSNPVHGTTNNPHNTTRTAGGSSGGEGAIIAAGGSPMGIGTDIGGSVRIPSLMCGIFGHKPTHDLISAKGQSFSTGEEVTSMNTPGPMTKYSEDIIPLLKALLGSKVNELKLNHIVNVSDLNIYYVTSFNTPSISDIGDEMKYIIARTVKYFNDRYKKPPQEFYSEDFASCMKIWRHWFLTQEKGETILKDLANRQGMIHPLFEIVKFFACTSELHIFSIMCILTFLMPPKPNEKWAREITAKLKTELLVKLGNNGVLLCPSSPWSARYHYTSIFRPKNFGYFAIWNALKMPVTQVPLGLDKEGLPVGIQVVAAPYQDHLCIAVAKELEKAFGGFVSPNTMTV